MGLKAKRAGSSTQRGEDLSNGRKKGEVQLHVAENREEINALCSVLSP